MAPSKKVIKNNKKKNSKKTSNFLEFKVYTLVFEDWHHQILLQWYLMSKKWISKFLGETIKNKFRLQKKLRWVWNLPKCAISLRYRKALNKHMWWINFFLLFLFQKLLCRTSMTICYSGSQKYSQKMLVFFWFFFRFFECLI